MLIEAMTITECKEEDENTTEIAYEDGDVFKFTGNNYRYTLNIVEVNPYMYYAHLANYDYFDNDIVFPIVQVHNADFVTIEEFKRLSTSIQGNCFEDFFKIDYNNFKQTDKGEIMTEKRDDTYCFAGKIKCEHFNSIEEDGNTRCEAISETPIMLHMFKQCPFPERQKPLGVFSEITEEEAIEAEIDLCEKEEENEKIKEVEQDKKVTEKKELTDEESEANFKKLRELGLIDENNTAFVCAKHGITDTVSIVIKLGELHYCAQCFTGLLHTFIKPVEKKMMFTKAQYRAIEQAKKAGVLNDAQQENTSPK